VSPASIFGGSVSAGTVGLLVLCLAVALGFEFVNGFHDTANAVATVIYTKSLKPGIAVLWSGTMNFAGVFTGTMLGGAAVAFGIVHLLPVDLLLHAGESVGLLMILSLLVSAVIWNLTTWYFGLPASSSHSLIGAILGVGVTSSLIAGHGFANGVNWAQAEKAGLALLVSPLVGFGGAAMLLLIAKTVIKDRRLYDEPHGDAPPPLWIRGLLVLTCTLVSFFHGSNDGQKGVGLIMLILIGILPTQFAVNRAIEGDSLRTTAAATQRIAATVNRVGTVSDADLETRLRDINAAVASADSLNDLSDTQRAALRADILQANVDLDKWQKDAGAGLAAADKAALKKDRGTMTHVTDFVVPWVPFAVALALGVGTTVGWKRIVVTVGEKIGKTHLTYAQGACAEIIAAVTIYLADSLGLPVSTTHVLSSGVAGTMAANHSGLQIATVRNIAAAWVLTLPATGLMAGVIFNVTAGGMLRSQATALAAAAATPKVAVAASTPQTVGLSGPMRVALAAARYDGAPGVAPAWVVGRLR
jgi:PiT family inorganic phosphate transporter